MNQENYEFLVDTMARHGFTHPMIEQQLKTKMTLGTPEFEIPGMKFTFDKDVVVYAAKFGKGEQKGDQEAIYYLNGFKADITLENGINHKAEFPLYNQRGNNKDQMHNLMLGRPVYKAPRAGEEGRWAKVDFKTTNDDGFARVRNYYDNSTGFNLERELDKLGIPWANQQDKANAITDLRNGELVSASYKVSGKRETQHIGVTPQIGGLVVYNDKMEVVKQTNTQSMEMMPEAGHKQGQSADKKNEKLPDQTVQMMESMNDDKKEGQGKNKSQKAS
jgi:hypothetical protein